MAIVVKAIEVKVETQNIRAAGRPSCFRVLELVELFRTYMYIHAVVIYSLFIHFIYAQPAFSFIVECGRDHRLIAALCKTSIINKSRI